MKISTGQEYAAKIINTKKLSARGEYTRRLCSWEKMPSDDIFFVCVNTDSKQLPLLL